MIEAKPCQDVSNFAAELVVLAWQRNETVQGRFNQFILEAKPGSTTQDVLTSWNAAQKQSYFGKPGPVGRRLRQLKKNADDRTNS